jgi:hypothetical protein
MTPNDLFTSPFSGRLQQEKENKLLPALQELTNFHSQNCEKYRHILDSLRPNKGPFNNLAEIPYLPVSLFKHRRLCSVPDSNICVTVRSSGTSGQQSLILLDSDTASRTAKALSNSLKHILGSHRLPMLIVDSEEALTGQELTARGTAIMGLMPFAREHCFALGKTMDPDSDKIDNFLAKHRDQKIVIFGFTFLVWQKFLSFCENRKYDLCKAILLHSGGWKKMTDRAVDNATYKQRLHQATNINRIINFYGMAELPGTIFFENTDGLFYAPDYADIIIRDPYTMQPAPNGQPGFIQILTALPRSYPGHSLLTEDMGVIESTDAGINGFYGKGFRILGRAPRAELRGCSDVMVAS